MTHEILKYIIIYMVIIFCTIFLDYKNSTKYWYVLPLFLFIGVMDNLFHTVTIHYPDLQLIDSHSYGNQYFCWSGKLYSIIFALILTIPLQNIITPSEIGLKIRQNKKSVRFSLIFILFFFVLAATLGLLSKKSSFDGETLLFNAIMPGLNEELIYRGLLLGLLNKIFERKFELFNTRFGWGAILTSLVFGILHGFWINDSYQIQFDFISIISSGIYGFVFALIRERSGSLVFPVIAHSTADFFNFFFRMI